MSARKDLAAELKPLLPKQWRLVDTERSIDKIDRFTVVIRQRKVKPAPNLQGSLLTTLVVTLIGPTTLAGDYEDALDLAVAKLILIVSQKLPSLVWEEANKKVWRENPAYDFDVTVVTDLITS